MIRALLASQEQQVILDLQVLKERPERPVLKVTKEVLGLLALPVHKVLLVLTA